MSTKLLIRSLLLAVSLTLLPTTAQATNAPTAFTTKMRIYGEVY